MERAGPQTGKEIDLDTNDMSDLVDIGLIRRADSSHGSFYPVPGAAVQFYKWRIEQPGPEPGAQMDHHVRSVIDDPSRLVVNHPQIALHLTAAFDRIWTDDLDDRTIIEIGGSLRSALNAMAADLVGHETSPEKVATVVMPWLAANPTCRLARTNKLLTAMVKAAVSSSQRLNHLHDERSDGQPDPTREEIRRTAFAVALCCYELDRLALP